MSDIKIGIYLCTCEGEIETVIDLDSLAKEASTWPGVTTVRKVFSLCSESGICAIREEVKSRGLDRVLIAACSPFFKAKEFSDFGINRYLVERVNIREQCSRIHADNPGDAAKKSKALLRVFLEKARYSRPLHPLKIPSAKSVLIVGGGVAGINAALDIAHAADDSEVFLIEKKPFLGGKTAELHRYFPRMCPPSCGLDLMYSRLESNANIHILASSEIDTLSGSPGNFEILIKSSPRHVDPDRCILCGKCLEVCDKNAVLYPEGPSFPRVPALRRELCEKGCEKCADSCPSDAVDLGEKDSVGAIKAGAVIVATGWVPFDPTPLTEYGYGRFESVITNLEFETIARKQKTFLNEPKKTAFIQCVGSRDERHLPYCSDVCCMVSIRQALSLKEANADNEVYIFYNDIRTPGEYENVYRQARKSGIKFIKGMPSELRQDAPGKINFSVFDTVAGERTEITVDTAVLATGMKSSHGNSDLKDKIGIVLNKNNFIESHLQCYPQDTQREGIFTAGCCRAPMDISRSIESAGAAAIKALQFLNRTIEVSPGYPVVNILKCDRCKRCMEECPFKAYSFDEHGFPKPDVIKCRMCGICMGSCPLGAISLGELSIEQLSGMLDVVDKSYLGDDEPVILGFLCKNDAYGAADDAGGKGIHYPPNLLSIMVPCSGAVNGAIISEAISKGVDGILIAGCPDSQCHYVQGSALAKARLADISNKLKEMYLEPERVRFVSISRDETEKFAEAVKDYVQELKKMGRNPLRIQ
jgi:heterodisulfide reductase subunit A-like polyferredoxin/coenzyme F420-reducing hydrogenase delta subunit